MRRTIRGSSALPRLVHLITAQRFFAVLVLLLLIFGFFALTQERFLTPSNLTALLTSVAILWVVSIGLTFVMLSGGFDLSVGSMLALAGVALGSFVNHLGVPVPVAVAITLLLGALLGGGINGVLVGRYSVPFLVATLGTLILFRGILNLWSGTRTQQVMSGFLDSIAFGRVLAIPVPLWIMAATFLIGLYVQRWTYFGRDIFAVGGNPDAAGLSGIKVTRTVISVYAISGLFAAFGGVLQTARIGAASPQVGEQIIFDATAAVLLGGTSFAGGIGGVGGTAVGVLFLATLQNGLAVSGAASFWQQIITGTILLMAVLLDTLRRSR